MKCTQNAKQGNKIRAKTCKPYGGCIASLGAEDFRSTDSKYYKNRYAPATSHFFEVEGLYTSFFIRARVRRIYNAITSM